MPLKIRAGGSCAGLFARVIAMTLLGPLPSTAQIEAGRIYQPGERISEPSLGLVLTLPVGWQGALSGDGSAFVMEPTEGMAALIVVAETMSESDARQQLAGPLDLGDGITLLPDGDVHQIATGHLSAAFDVRGTPQPFVSTVDVRLTPSGLGVAFILLAEPGSAEARREEMRELALSLGVSESRAQSTTQSASDAWEPYLRGRYLARFYSGSSYTESTEIWLCSDGTFFFNDQSGGYGAGASGAYQARDRGRWSASGAGTTGALILMWSGGERSTWSLEYDYDAERLYMNGDRWLRGNNERCS